MLFKSPLPQQFAGKSLAPNLLLQSGACVAKTMMPWLCQPGSERDRHPGLLEIFVCFGGMEIIENLGNQRDVKLQEPMSNKHDDSVGSCPAKWVFFGRLAPAIVVNNQFESRQGATPPKRRPQSAGARLEQKRGRAAQPGFHTSHCCICSRSCGELREWLHLYTWILFFKMLQKFQPVKVLRVHSD